MDNEGKIAEEVKLFIARYIFSVEQLEILILLSGSSERMWTVRDVYEHIQSQESTIGSQLELLVSQGFLVSKKMPGLAYQFSPTTEDLRKGVQALSVTYQERRVKVIELICGQSQERLREFSDAFKIRRTP